jgi:Na+-transporting NADH:ubiquinone oxidoreductase subunit C
MKNKLLMIVFVLVLGSILTAALLVVENYTTPLIEANKVRTLRESILDALSIPYQEGNVEERFSENVTEKKLDGHRVYFSREGSVAFEIEGSGVWGPIEGVLSLDRDFKTIKKLVIIHQEETPGLGGRISEREFLDKFEGTSILPKIELVPHGRVQHDNQVEAITGATMSSNALQAILNNEIRIFTPLLSDVEAK